MSKLADFRAIERQLADQLAQLETLKQDDQLNAELAFNDELKALIKAYGLSKREVVAILHSAS
ncbi:hypothetical protein [Halopseudomonas salegens]|uniref:H-NS histone family protein n=1 Tax=Halopseudomonas salegens TaxID=1434072 RepID=A0A1H2H409_9GAMM|nr:hypothetical protein [Halopseudomonas salegens]SDU26553.1 hypothetical protein SAMN05216210_2755 [Halopseudomonas salegens]